MSNKVKVSNNTGDVTGYRVDNFQYTSIGKIILYRLLNNRDVKILITSSGNTTGTGKTQLAIILARIISKYCAEIFNHTYHWSAQEYSFMDVYEYLEKYDNCSGRVLLTDELEYLADRRRSMSHQNVHFSQAWQMLRYANNVTIGTAPGIPNLDERVTESTDIWINIQYPGVANSYYVTINDFTHQTITKRIKQCGFSEMVKWEPIDEDPDYQYLNQEKRDIGVPGLDSEEALSEEDINQAEKEYAKEVAINLLEMKDNGLITLDQNEMGKIVGYSQQWVSTIKKQETDL